MSQIYLFFKQVVSSNEALDIGLEFNVDGPEYAAGYYPESYKKVRKTRR